MRDALEKFEARCPPPRYAPQLAELEDLLLRFGEALIDDGGEDGVDAADFESLATEIEHVQFLLGASVSPAAVQSDAHGA